MSAQKKKRNAGYGKVALYLKAMEHLASEKGASLLIGFLGRFFIASIFPWAWTHVIHATFAPA
jgi:hypothetical protein